MEGRVSNHNVGLTVLHLSYPHRSAVVGWASSHKVQCRQFDSWSGHMPGLRVRSQSGCVQEATNRCFFLTSMFLSLSFSLPSPLSKNKFLAQNNFTHTPLIQLCKSGNESHTENKWPQPRPVQVKLTLFQQSKVRRICSEPGCQSRFRPVEGAGGVENPKQDNEP